MRKIAQAKKTNTVILAKELTFEDKQKMVDVFAWLIKEDKKQNPLFYQLNNSKKND